jgi:hypothetical protein
MSGKALLREYERRFALLKLGELLRQTQALPEQSLPSDVTLLRDGINSIDETHAPDRAGNVCIDRNRHTSDPIGEAEGQFWRSLLRSGEVGQPLFATNFAWDSTRLRSGDRANRGARARSTRGQPRAMQTKSDSRRRQPQVELATRQFG